MGPGILFAHPDDDIRDDAMLEPACFQDLHLDQIVSALTADYEEYHLNPFFYAPLHRADDVRYRQEVFEDLRDDHLYLIIRTFAKEMQSMRQLLSRAEKNPNTYQNKGWFLEAARIYTEAIQSLADALSKCSLESRGFLAMLTYLNQYSSSEQFISLAEDITRLSNELAGVAYTIHIRGNEVTVCRNVPDEEYYQEVADIFSKFLTGPGTSDKDTIPEQREMSQVEGRILDLVSRLFQNEFSHLDTFQEKHAGFADETICRFDRDIHFYIAYLEFISCLKQKGLPFCTPLVSETSKEICCTEGFDLALANSLLSGNRSVVPNDFFLQQEERILVITGPNQGGKTTFARMYGQLHHLASLGCPVPGRTARLFLPDKLFTHFEQEEDINTFRSKLEDDLERIHTILNQCTPRSIIIINEIFSSTTVQDALFLGHKVLDQVIDQDILCIYVTFLDELTTLPKTVSMVSTVVVDDPDQRTYRIERKPADGLSYAMAIARKNQVTYEKIKERMRS